MLTTILILLIANTVLVAALVAAFVGILILSFQDVQEKKKDAKLNQQSKEPQVMLQSQTETKE